MGLVEDLEVGPVVEDAAAWARDDPISRRCRADPLPVHQVPLRGSALVRISHAAGEGHYSGASFALLADCGEQPPGLSAGPGIFRKKIGYTPEHFDLLASGSAAASTGAVAASRSHVWETAIEVPGIAALNQGGLADSRERHTDWCDRA
jgi:hypothetical protein